MPITSAEKPLEPRADLELKYDEPSEVPTNYSVVCLKTPQEAFVLTIQNTSATSVASVFITPSAPPEVPALCDIPANDPTPRNFTHNWKGARLKIANVSQQDVKIRVHLRPLTKTTA